MPWRPTARCGLRRRQSFSGNWNGPSRNECRSASAGALESWPDRVSCALGAEGRFGPQAAPGRRTGKGPHPRHRIGAWVKAYTCGSYPSPSDSRSLLPDRTGVVTPARNGLIAEAFCPGAAFMQDAQYHGSFGKPRIAGVHVALRTLESRDFWKLPKLDVGGVLHSNIED